jgi:CBS domain-containing protein
VWRIIMLVKNWMSRHVFTIKENDSMSDANELMKIYRIHILPVLKR